MIRVLMYSTRWCPFCVMARRLLKSKGVAFEEIPVDGDAARRAEMQEKTGRHTVPQIFIGDRHVGGYDDLRALDGQGGLDPLLREVARGAN
ncbi:MAG: glutaredoxin 3 [Gammaproteobacteria bacterium]|nr:glutaredoxin 3 [Gammaproteobacteria bacterium]